MRLAAASILALCACAGSGRVYPCDPDAGNCSDHSLPDGGAQPQFISQPSTVFHDGAHASFPDVLPFQGALFAAFRRAPAWSVDATAQVFVLRSGDKGKTWDRTATLSLSGRDLRQPRLFVFGGKLRVLATAWEESNPSAHHTTLQLASSDDGYTFGAFSTVANQAGVSAWRPRQLGASLFFSVWAADELFPASTPNQLGILQSDDALAFSTSTAPPVGPGGREGELAVRADGQRALLVPERALLGGVEHNTFCHATKEPASPAWACWSAPGPAVESPAMFEWNGFLYVAGKREAGAGHKRTAVWQVMEDDHQLQLVANVESSFGDTGGPSVVALDASHALLLFHTTSSLDPRVAALGHEPTEVEAQGQALSGDILAVTLDMASAQSGN